MTRRIFVIDDELPVLEGVRHIVESSFPSGEICGTSTSGITALELIDHDPPDILLVDIHLPGISGLEILNDMRRRHPSVLCIIISAYEQFSIAKEALDFGVFAYIVKPVTKARLLKVLQGACEELDREDQLHAADLAGKALRQSVDGLLERQLVPQLFSGIWRPDSERWELWLTSLRRVRPDFFPKVTAAFVEYSEGGSGPRIAAALRYKLPCWTGVVESRGVGVLASASYPGLQTALREGVREAINMSRSGFVDEPSIRCSEPIPLERIWEVLPTVLPRQGDNESYAEASGELREGLQQLWRIVRAADKGVLDAWLSRYRPVLDRVLGLHREYACALLLEPVFAAYPPPLVPPDSVTWLGRQATSGEMLNALVVVLQEATPTVADYAGESRSLHEALEFLRRRFSEPVSLEDVAAVAGISAAHLSRLFRQELRLSFSDYLTSLRMEQAQRLLVDATHSIKEVGYSVGYQDANYFSRVFKRWVGVRPREFAATQSISGEHPHV